MPPKIALFFSLLIVFTTTAFSQTQTNEAVLKQMATTLAHSEKEIYQKTLNLAKEKGWPLTMKGKGDNIAVLIGVDPSGYPIYYTTLNNTIAAATTRASALWPGGSSGLNLNGSSASVSNKMGEWDGGSVRNTHVELNNRVVLKQPSVAASDHATHVAGTMIASGVNPNAKGMAYAYNGLISYDFNNDASEMSGEASGLLLSNHSYGAITGWYYNQTQSRWEFWGRSTENEDYKFGTYDNSTMVYDSIAYNAPYYLIVKSSGNNRSENGPAVGQPYFRYNASGVMEAAGNRPAGISSNDGYDIISTYGNAKNILTVGAVNGLPFGYSRKEDVVVSAFSSFGPTDDGRIKPDIVADGVNLFSSIATSDNSYDIYSGTSMAAPNATGSLLLLQEYYNRLHPGTFMRAATLKAIAIHAADEAGPGAGPDYQFGWGLLNVAKGAEVIKSNNTGSHLIQENVLANGATFTLPVIASGQGTLSATIVWTDPKAAASNGVLNDRTRKLVNDLDIRIVKGSTTYQPWILDPNNPASTATQGDNVLDNVERINIDGAIPGETYTIKITHKGTLDRGQQAYSLVVSGVGGQAYCTSAATSNSGSRIDSVGFGTIHQVNPAGCTTYTNYTGVSAAVEPNQTLPISVKVGSCDASNVAKIVKVFIDFNNDGDFADAGELVATSGAITNGIFTSQVTVPTSVTVGNSSIMRIVVQETSNAANVNACGTYANGETQDYKITFAPPSSDLAAQALIYPANGSCANPAQLATVRIQNNSITDKSNIPVSVIVKNGTATVATINGIFPGTIPAGSAVSYTLQTPFNTTAGITYSFEVRTNDATDQNRANDTLRTTVAIATAPATPSGTAEICGSTGLLRVTNPVPATNYFWYVNATTDSSIATGTNTSTTIVPANNTYYVGSGARGKVGLPSKSVYPNGGGYLTSNSANYMTFTATVPTVLESATLYSKYPGKIDFIVADITSTTPTGYSYQVLSTTTVDIYATSPTPAPGAVSGFDAADNGALFNLNLYLPAGNHAIIIRPIGEANIFRNNNVTGDPYPFTLPNVISFTGNSASSPNNFQNFYYALYNMSVHTVDCISDRAAVVATVAPTPTVTQEADSLVSSSNTNNQWNLNGSPISGATGKKYKPVQSGSYTVTVTDGFGCQRTSAATTISITAIDPVSGLVTGLNVLPNPNNGIFTVKFQAVKKEDLHVEITNLQGQKIMLKSVLKFVGTYSEKINLTQQPSGVYILKVQHGDKVWYEKIVIRK